MNYFKNFTVLILLFYSFVSYSQKNLTYQTPKKEILDLVDVDRAPSVLKDEKKFSADFCDRGLHLNMLKSFLL